MFLYISTWTRSTRATHRRHGCRDSSSLPAFKGNRGQRGGAGGEERGLCHPLVGAAGLAPSGGPSHLWEAASDWSGLGATWRLTRQPTPLSSCRSVPGAAARLPRSPGVRAGGIPSCDRRGGREGGAVCGRVWAARAAPPLGGKLEWGGRGWQARGGRAPPVRRGCPRPARGCVSVEAA